MLSTIRRQTLLVVLLVLTVTIISVTVISQSTYLRSLKDQTYTSLTSHNEYIQTMFEKDGTFSPSRLQQYADLQSVRITIIAQSGTVLFDSEYNEAEMESHLYREEVQESLKAGYGMSDRFSATQRVPVLYFATFNGKELPFIRVSTPLAQLREHRAVFTRYMVLSSLILLALTVIITVFSLGRITKPLEDVKDLAEEYAKGNLKAKKLIHGPREVHQLSVILHAMAQQLDLTLGELNTSRSMIETMINSVSQGLILLDADLSVRIANRPSYDMIGTDQVLEGKPIHRILQSAALMERLRQALKDQKGTTLTLEHYDHLWGDTARVVGREQTKTILITIDPVGSSSDNLAVVISLTDMSERAKLEQMRKDFVANVSHELKTPITAIAGFAHTLLDEGDELSEEQTRYLGIIQRQSSNMLTVIQDLLLLSSLEKDNTSLSRSWVDIDHVVQQSLLSCRYKAEEKDITITDIVMNPEDLSVYLHPMLIQQALTNLIMNAITYSGEHTRVDVSVLINDEQIIFKVKDQGPGIAREDQERIFERFYRVDAARSRSQGGTGLGLSIVKHIAQAHDGTVSVESTLGQGSVFTITISRKGKEFSSLSHRRDEMNS